jgi:tetratricopeptide (TPR) repeat protein
MFNFLANKSRVDPVVSFLVAIVLAILPNCSAALSDQSSSFVLDQSRIKLIPLAKDYLREGKTEAAKNLLETMLQLQPKDAEAHLYLGKAYALQKDYPKARSELLRCLKWPDHTEISKAANQELLKLPRRFLCPKQIGTLSVSVFPQCSNKACLLVFYPSWQENSIGLKEAVESVQLDLPSVAVKMIEITDPAYREISDLYSIRVVPTIILLSANNRHMVAFWVGEIPFGNLGLLVKNHLQSTQ